MTHTYNTHTLHVSRTHRSMSQRPSPTKCVYRGVFLCVRVCARARACVCVYLCPDHQCVSVCACVHVCVTQVSAQTHEAAKAMYEEDIDAILERAEVVDNRPQVSVCVCVCVCVRLCRGG